MRFPEYQRIPQLNVHTLPSSAAAFETCTRSTCEENKGPGSSEVVLSERRHP